MTDIKTGVFLVDDHRLLRRGMIELIEGFSGYTVIGDADNGIEFIKKLPHGPVPDILLLDINMPEMNGYETAAWIRDHHPEIKVLALSMYEDETAIIRMIKTGACGYILKDADPSELRKAFDDIVSKGFYYSELVSHALAQNLREDGGQLVKMNLSEREMEFLKLACSEMTYKEIADKMCLAPRTIDGYREALFEKLNVKSRVGLVLYAVRKGVVKLDEPSA